MIENSKMYNLEARTLEFAREIIRLCKVIPPNTINFKIIDQIVRSGSSVGANYREANETETKKDFHFRIRICRKEAKETYYWLQLMIEANSNFKDRIEVLMRETGELIKIFAAIALKVKVNSRLEN
ncbi:MAG: four helix bundle protein [Patescibacteria group bacterium]